VLKPMMTVVAFLVRYFKLLAITLGGALAVALIADAVLFTALGLAAWQTAAAMIASAAATAAAWIVAAAPFLFILAVIGLIVLLAEDLYVGLKGGKSIFGLIFNWIDKLPGMIGDAFVDGFMYLWDAAKEFLAWFEEQARKVGRWLNPFDINDTSSSGTRGTGAPSPTFDRLTAFTGAVGRGEGVASAGRYLRPRGTSGGSTVTMGAPTIIVNPAPGQDERAIGKEVKRQIDEHWQGKVDELGGALGNTR
jgi:hypothetical protein